MKNETWILFFLLLTPFAGWGNNLQLSRAQKLGPQQVQVTIRWESSWQLDSTTAPGNHDAVWLFLKAQEPNRPWQHLHLTPDSSAHSVLSGNVELLTVEDSMGVFIRLNEPTTGTAEATLQLSLAEPLMGEDWEIRFYGIEMVWVPEGSYWLGDGGSNFAFTSGQDSLRPLEIVGEGELAISPVTGNLYSTASSLPSGSVPAGFPKGFSGFYCMKYELTQEQWVDFLNTLTYEQQVQHTVQPPSSPAGTFVMTPSQQATFRNGVVVKQPGVSPDIPAVFAMNANAAAPIGAVNDGHSRASNFLHWEDLLAYLDWSGLRPMTEMEYEKASRGPLQPVPREFAWGTDKSVDGNTVVQDGTPEESVTEKATAAAGLASHGYLGVHGPLRSGFGGSATSGRLQAGAGYWGIWELSGNLWEQAVGVLEDGLSFSGLHGDGQLSTAGVANVHLWPPASGAIFRGGGWLSGIVGEFRDLAVSDRFYHELPPQQRKNTAGGRGVRSFTP